MVTDMDNPDIDRASEQPDSCDSSYSRKQFLSQVVKRAGLVGVILATPKIVDKFLVPPACAAAMYSPNSQEDTTGNRTDSG